MAMNLTIKHKLLIFGLIGTAFSCLVGLSGYWGATALTDSMNDIVVKAEALRDHMEIHMMHDAMRGDVLAALQAGDAATHKAVQDDFNEHKIHIREMLAVLDALPLDETVRKGVAETKPHVESYLQKAEAIIGTAAQDGDKATAQFPEFIDSFRVLEQDLSRLSDLIEAGVAGSKSAGQAVSALSKKVMIGVSLVALLVLLTLSILITRGILAPLANLQSHITELSRGEGDLTRRLAHPVRDEIGSIVDAFNDFLGKLHDMVYDVRKSVETVSDATQSLSGQSRDVNKRAGELTDRIMSISSATEEMSGAVSEGANSIGSVAQAAARAHSIAEAGGENTRRSMEITQELADTVRASAADIQTLNQSVSKIGEIAGVIKDIADQTNLLALNAAIEAARAGEQGRGFAVVADEVRKLAERTSASTADISNLIDTVQGATGQTVRSMERVGKQVEEGLGHVQAAQQTLGQILNAAEEVTRTSRHIADAAREQSGAVEEAARNMEKVSTLTEQNAAAIGTVDQAVAEIAQTAQVLRQRVERFKVAGR